MRLLALDTSTHVGWALFANPGRLIDLGTFDLPPVRFVGDHGRRWVAFEDWLGSQIVKFRPSIVAWEMAADSGGAVRLRNSGPVTRLLQGLTCIAETVATRHGTRAIEVPIVTAKKKLAGDHRAGKGKMILAALNAGHVVADDHQADAIAVAEAAYSHALQV